MNRRPRVVFLFLFATLTYSDIYPWGKSSLEDRQEDLLDSFRNNMILELKREVLEAVSSKGADGKLIYPISTLKNLEGKIFLVNVTDANAITDPSFAKYKPFTSKRLLSKVLKGACAFYNLDYWSFEWCHRKDVRQVHVEFMDGKAIRNPEWSLGSYERTKVIRAGTDPHNDNAPITKMIDYFTGGQMCHETGGFRSTNVIFQCCPNSSPPSAEILKQAGAGLQQMLGPNAKFVETAFVESVVEKTLCQYEIIVCVPSMCAPTPTKNNKESKETKNNLDNTAIVPAESTPEREGLSLLPVIQSLSKLCMYRQEEWWTYEVCFGTGIRQFHARFENFPQPNGMINQQQVIETQYSLGSAPVEIYSNATALYLAAGMLLKSPSVRPNNAPSNLHIPAQPPSVEPTIAPSFGRKTQDDRRITSTSSTSKSANLNSSPSNFLPLSGLPVTGFGRGQGPKVITLEFLNGTECDIEHTQRSSSLLISCGPKEMVTDIIEDRTCHYNIKMTSPLLCQLTDFAPVKQELGRLTLNLIDVIPEELIANTERSDSSTKTSVHYLTDDIRSYASISSAMTPGGKDRNIVVPGSSSDEDSIEIESREKAQKKRAEEIADFFLNNKQQMANPSSETTNANKQQQLHQQQNKAELLKKAASVPSTNLKLKEGNKQEEIAAEIRRQTEGKVGNPQLQEALRNGRENKNELFRGREGEDENNDTLERDDNQKSIGEEIRGQNEPYGYHEQPRTQQLQREVEEGLKPAEKIRSRMRETVVHIGEPIDGEYAAAYALNRQQNQYQQNPLQIDDDDNEQMPETPESHIKIQMKFALDESDILNEKLPNRKRRRKPELKPNVRPNRNQNQQVRIVDEL